MYPKTHIDATGLGFDFDGVIADTAATFLRLACEQHNHCDFRLEEITDFEVEDCLGLPPDIVHSLFYQIMADSLGVGLEPMPGALQVLTALSRSCTVHVITARRLAQPVHDWFATVLPAKVCENINLVAMGDHDDKVRHVRQLGLTAFIDDRVETCLQLSSAGLHPIVFQQPWNQGRHDLQSVANWQQIGALLNLNAPAQQGAW
ncbi:MAG: hypothetical protein CSA34_00580 [Desulfobulbus propionicus]|nr:MAG: hypothetical protein CSA34_00580 [Desulfobulbus propionicus]